MPKATARLEQKSPAEFFAENKNIAGFDNPGKCLYTTVRELVENSLDAAESIELLPDIDIEIIEVAQADLNDIRGMVNLSRLDTALYQDFETDGDRKKREARDVRNEDAVRKLIAKGGEDSAAVSAKRKEIARQQAEGAAKTKQFYKVVVRDNGAGMRHEDIPDMLGRVLSGTKFGVRQTRGKFGLGAKMALIWSKMSTGMPVEILSARPGQSFISFYKLDIDIHKNQPNVHQVKKLPNDDNWQGAQLSLIIAGQWAHYRMRLLKYLRQIAVITPYLQSTFRYTAAAGDAASAIDVTFRRRSNKMPPLPLEVKYHPSSMDLELTKRLVLLTKCSTLSKFLVKEFSCIPKPLAERLVEEMRSGVDAHTSPKDLTVKQITRLHQLMHEAKFRDPNGHHLSPAGEYNLRLGIVKELAPEMVSTYQGDAKVLEGHAFIVEAAVSLGGRELRPGLNVYRFANRIPLLFEGGSDVITKTAMKRINWANYKINQTTDRIGVFVSIVSTHIPFKGAGKEYIADDVDEMVQAVKASLQSCCNQLRVKIQKKLAIKEQNARRKNLTKYIPNAAAAIFTVLEKMTAVAAAVGSKRRRLESTHDLLEDVRSKKVLESTLSDALAAHVERIDTDMALEYQLQQRGADARKDLYLVPCRDHQYGPAIHANSGVLQLLQSGAL